MSGIALQSAPNGVFADVFGNVLGGRQVKVVARDNPSTSINVYATDALTGSPLSQPLTTQSDGSVPGYADSSVAFDFLDVATNKVKQGWTPPGLPSSVDYIGSTPVGTSNGQSKIVRADGTVGYVDNEINLKGWQISNPNLGNGSNDDTVAIQAWANAGIANNAKLVAPPPSNCYTLTGTVYLHPSGTNSKAQLPQMEWRGRTGGGIVQWKGGNGVDGARLAAFHLSGLKSPSKITGLEVRLPAGTESYVTAFECDNFCTTLQQNISSATAAGTSVAVGSTQHLRQGQQVGVGATGNLLTGAELLTIASIVDATHVTFTTAPVSSHSIGDRFESPYTSMGEITFEQSQMSGPGGQHGLVNMRWMHTDTTSADASAVNFVNCAPAVGAPSGAKDGTGIVGYQFEGSNECVFNIIGGGGGALDKWLSTLPTTGCGHTGLFGGGTITVNGVAVSNSAYCDIEYTTPSQTLVIKGASRFQNVAGNSCQFLIAGNPSAAAASPIKVLIDGATIQGYNGDSGNPATGKLFNCHGSVSLTLENCVIGASATGALYGASMVSFDSNAAASTVAVFKHGGNVVWASGTFYTAPSNLLAFRHVHDGTDVLMSTSNNVAGVVGPPGDVQVFTGNGTWTKPSGSYTVSHVVAIGAGGGGGSGRRTASGTAASGGGGGGGGGWAHGILSTVELPATVTVTAGAAGAGGAAVTADSTNGNAGTSPSGGAQFGSYVKGGAGSGGGAGGTANSAAGTAGTGMVSGGPGGAGVTGAAGGAGGQGNMVPGGGGGGGLAVTPAVTAGGNGGPSFQNASQAGGTGGTTDGQAGGNGTPPADSNLPIPGSGGGGGASSIVAAGGNGGSGAAYGAGGGGGGASLNGNNSGAGGAGGGPIVIVITR